MSPLAPPTLLGALRAVTPEALLLGGALCTFLAAASSDRTGRRRAAGVCAVLAALGALVAAWQLAPATATGGAIFDGLLVLDGWVTYVRILACLGLLCVGATSWRFAEVDDLGSADDAMAEYAGLLLTATASASLMAGAHDLLSAALALEVASLPSYLLVAFRRRAAIGTEAALKYVIYGSVASGVSLFGFSWLYGAAQGTAFDELGRAFARAPAAASVGALMVLAGLAFKLAVVPFHMWAPDAYEGAPLPVAMFISFVPKAGALILLGRLVASLSSPVVTGAVAVLAALSMTWGNVAALAQTRVRRLLAYSAISHAGTLLLAFVGGGALAADALAIYLGAYLFMSLAAFVAVGALAELGAESLADYRGLGARAPLPAATLPLALVSLTGLPPLAGFLAKFSLFAALWGGRPADGLPSQVPLVLVILGVLNTVVSLAYYARPIKALYFEAAPDIAPVGTPTPPGAVRLRNGLLLALSLGTLVLGLFPSRFLGWAAAWTSLPRRELFVPRAERGEPNFARGHAVFGSAGAVNPLRDEPSPR